MEGVRVAEDSKGSGDSRWGSVSEQSSLLQTVQLMKALSTPHRIQIIAALNQSDSGGACVAELVDLLGLSQSTVSHHLKVLLEASLITRDKKGKLSWYAIRDDCVSLVGGILD